MRKIRNPFLTTPGYHCFGCSPANPLGLHLEFWQDGKDVVAFWLPQGDYQGWGNILHGGIQTTLIDEIGAWAILMTCEAAGVTTRLEMKFIKPVSTQAGQLTIRSRVREVKRRIVIVESEIHNSAGELCSQGLAHYFTFSRENAPEYLRFPQRADFFEPEEHAAD
jgi:uncharacterized protein (TIGR00369 family)